MATQPSNNFDITQLDLTDPETRAYAESQLDLTDPDTKAFWDQQIGAIQTPTPVVPTVAGAPFAEVQAPQEEGNLLERLGESFTSSIEDQGGWGISPELRRVLGAGGPISTLRPVTDLPANLADVVYRGLQAGGAAAGALAEEADRLAVETGLAETLATEGGQFLPGSAFMALSEAFPLAGAEMGLNPLRTNPARELQAAARPRAFTVEEYRQTLQNMVNEGRTADEIREFVASTGADPSLLRGVDEAVAARQEGLDVGVSIQPDINVMQRLSEEAAAFQQRPKEPVSSLEQEAAAFRGAREPTAEDLFPTEETLRQREADLETRLQQEADAFVRAREPETVVEEPTAIQERVPTEETPVLTKSPEVEAADTQIKTLTKDWSNAPRYEVVDNHASIADPEVKAAMDPDAIAGVLPDGRVVVNLENVKLEAQARNVRPTDILNSAVYHEGLGHHGLLQQFNTKLDNLLMAVYEGRKGNFKTLIDDWVVRNPNAYAEDPLPLARAVEEVLAEVSERGRISPSILGRIRNTIKDFGRRMGFDLKYSDGEILTILGMAHDATIKGVPNRSAKLNGFRSMTRREQITGATKALADTPRGQTKSIQPFPEEEPMYWRFRHVTDDGQVVTGTYDVVDGKLDNFSISTEGGPRSIGPAAVRKIGRQLLEQHPEASRIAGFRISGARPTEKFAESGTRFMRRTVGKGSEGPLQGGSRKEGDELGMGRFRSSENIEEILAEGAPENTREYWDDWIEEAESLRKEVVRNKGIKGAPTPPKVLALREAIVKSANRIAALSRKSVDGTLTEREEYLLFAEMARNADMQDVLQGVRSNAARIVNSFKIAVESDESFSDAVRTMMRSMDNKVLSDPALRKDFLKKVSDVADDPAAIKRLAKDAFEPKAEDYIFSAWYNLGLLSRPSTQFNNLIGTMEHLLGELPRYGFAALYGLPRGLINKNAERIIVDEVVARGFGMAAGAIDGLMNMPKAFLKGQPLTKGLKEQEEFAPLSQYFKNKAAASKEGSPAQRLYKAGNLAGMSAEVFTRTMAATDELFRSMAALSEIYGSSIRKAYDEGGSKDLWSRAAFNRQFTTQETVERAVDYARRMTYRDEPSRPAKLLETFLTRKAASSKAGRAARIATRIMVPFITTPDALIRASLRDMPIMGALDRYNKADWASGPRGRDLVKGRMSLGLGLGLYAASLAASGDLTGEGPSDYRKKAELEASGWKANSIRNSDGTYTSIDNLGPLSTYMRGVATMADRYKYNEIDDLSYTETLLDGLLGFVKTVADNTWTEGLFDYMEVLTEGGLTTTPKNALAGAGASFLTPGFVQAYNQAFLDPARRVTSGEGTLEDRFTGRVASAWPGSEELPQRHDAYGRPMSRPGGWLQFLVGDRFSEKTDPSDPAVLEVNRLVQKFPKTVVSLPKYEYKVDDKTVKMNAEESQAFQKLSGEWIIADIREDIDAGLWDDLTDEEKVKEVKKIAAAARKDAKKQLFGSPEEGQEEEEILSPEALVQ